ncbi:PEP-CTERM sorting domain-containing protein [Janthinobacterium sp. FT14W]|uniref:PEP-CTERM sorting domain-containing protein n=1 Tax=Janthinobacterium sp. FT14W TaxID=2654253 RepID=UPI001D029510|nr:PEP-CTERM sorting domain-containing protein [Janthinobacterium sp. FT14W]
MPTPIFTPASSRPLLLAAALMLFGASAQAQTQAAAPAQQNEKNCQASTHAANGNAKDANLDGTYSACSLANGFIGAGTRTNDGTNKTPEFNGGVSDQEFRNAQSGDNNHRLATRQLPADSSAEEPRKALANSDRNFRFATRDFVASEENRPFDDGPGYTAPGRSYNQARGSDTYAPLVVSRPLGDGLPTGSNGGGVGGGGSGGGFTGGSIIPVTPDIPAVPEPETYAMLLAGLGLVALARRRKSK